MNRRKHLTNFFFLLTQQIIIKPLSARYCDILKTVLDANTKLARVCTAVHPVKAPHGMLASRYQSTWDWVLLAVSLLIPIQLPANTYTRRQQIIVKYSGESQMEFLFPGLVLQAPGEWSTGLKISLSLLLCVFQIDGTVYTSFLKYVWESVKSQAGKDQVSIQVK